MRPKGMAKRALLLDTAEKLIVEEGYSAVTTRRVGKEARIGPPLVHYYFPATEDLLLAVYRRAAEQSHLRTLEALSAERPLETFWRLSRESAHTGLGTEFYALANRRDVIRGEIVRTGDAARLTEAEVLTQSLGASLDRSVCDPLGLLVLITGMSRVLVMEEAVGVTAGHAEARALIDWLLASVQHEPTGKASEGAPP